MRKYSHSKRILVTGGAGFLGSHLCERPIEPRMTFAPSGLEACNDADALVIVTEWKEFRSPDFLAIKARLRKPFVFDGRNLCEPNLPRGAGLQYFALCRNPIDEVHT